MSQWKSSVSLGEAVEKFGAGETTLMDFVVTCREEFRKNPFYGEPDIRHAVEALADMYLPSTTKNIGLLAGKDLAGKDRASYRKALDECEHRLQMLERICAKDNRVYVSRVLRHFEKTA